MSKQSLLSAIKLICYSLIFSSFSTTGFSFPPVKTNSKSMARHRRSDGYSLAQSMTSCKLMSQAKVLIASINYYGFSVTWEARNFISSSDRSLRSDITSSGLAKSPVSLYAGVSASENSYSKYSLTGFTTSLVVLSLTRLSSTSISLFVNDPF